MAELRASDRVLDLACGTGDLLFSAVPPARSGVGLDVTHRMLQLAQQRRNDPRAPLVTADMLALPFGDGHFTVVTTGYGLRNVPDLDQALREIHRVLAPGGRLLSLDFNRPDNPLVRGVYHAYLTASARCSASRCTAIRTPIATFPSRFATIPVRRPSPALMTHYGFIDVRVVPVLGGLMAIHVARKPSATPKPNVQPPTIPNSQLPTRERLDLGVVGRWALELGIELPLEPGFERGGEELEHVVFAQLIG